MSHFQILANSPEEKIYRLASLVLQEYPTGQVKLLSGPNRGLVMLRVRETVANSLFNAGEILVTEVKLELEGQFGYGMVIGDSPRRAIAIALIDAALHTAGPLVTQLERELALLESQLQSSKQQMYKIAATTKVDFEII